MLDNKGIDVEVIYYLKTPLSPQELKSISVKLNLHPKEFLRKKDSRYKELDIDNFNGSKDELFQTIIDNPRILERPIIVSEEKAVIGRPPENILNLL